MNSWWKVTQFVQHITASRQISIIMAISMGIQPWCMQHNFEKRICQICLTYDNDSPTHVLFECPALTQIRDILWRRVIDNMPHAMQMQL